MAGAIIYESSEPWNPSRPDTVIISCTDGRWRAHIQEFALQHLKADSHADILSVPGGIEPLTLVDLIPKDFSFFRRRLESLVEGHGTRRIVAIAHQDCGWYRTRTVLSMKLDLRERQIADLRRAAARLREMLPGVAVETYFARLDAGNPPRVVFEAV